MTSLFYAVSNTPPFLEQQASDSRSTLNVNEGEKKKKKNKKPELLKNNSERYSKIIFCSTP